MPVRSVIIPDVSKAKAVRPSTQTKEQPTTTVTTYDRRNYVGNPTTGFYPKLFKMTPEQVFDFKLASGTKMKNGATLIRPVILSLGQVLIKPIDDGQYSIKSSVSENTLTMSEEELKDTKWLSRGTIKQMDDDRFILDYTDKDGEPQFVEATKEEAIQILNDNIYYM